jgi:hypothetical protein
MNRKTPPKPDEFELSVIGPGRGECIIVHLGWNEWCVVDSCTAPNSNIPAAVEYISTFGREAVAGVQLLIATHWHDDHIRGISSALRAFENAKFSCSIALQTSQFAELVELTSETVQQDSGLDEFRGVFDVLIERSGQRRGRRLVAPAFAIENRELLKLTREHSQASARIIALSPSDGTYRDSLRLIAELIPVPDDSQRRIPNVTPNKTSVVIWITAGLRSVLLGADLEHSTRSEEGWFAVLNAHHEETVADFFKVPHHGSSNADCPEVWSSMLGPNPIAVITPFSSGVKLPRQLDLDRLRSRTSNLYCTARSQKRPPRREGVDKLIRDVERFALEGQLGHVRIRCGLLDQRAAQIELFNGAFKVDPSETEDAAS